MPKRKNYETSEQQSARFIKAARAMIGAGELNPTAAEKAMDNVVRNARTAKPPVSKDSERND